MADPAPLSFKTRGGGGGGGGGGGLGGVAYKDRARPPPRDPRHTDKYVALMCPAVPVSVAFTGGHGNPDLGGVTHPVNGCMRPPSSPCRTLSYGVEGPWTVI